MKIMNQPEHKIIKSSIGAGHRRMWQVWALLLAGLIVTTLVAHYTKLEVDQEAKLEFDSVCNEIQSKILDQLNAHEQILRSGSAFFDHSGDVSREDWHRFSERQKIDENLPGIEGIGFALLIPKQDLAQHVQEIRAEGFPHYQVHPEGEREIYSSIIYLEPFTNRNLRAFGYDMFSEPVRRTAMERSRDQDSAALSGKVILVQETGTNVQAGTLMYVPVYRVGMAHDTIDQRRNALVGWVYSPYRMNDLMQGILGRWDLTGGKRIHLEVFDSNKVSSDTLLYDSQPGEAQHTGAASPLTLKSEVVSAGRQWTLRFTRNGNQLATANYNRVWLVLFGGTSASVLLAGLFFSVLNTRFKALRMARELTTELRDIEMRQRSIFDVMTDGVVVQAADGRITDCNLNAEKILGLSRDEIMGLTSVDPRWQAVRADGSVFPGEDHPAMVSLRTGQACHDVLMGLHLPDGSKRWININAEPMVRKGETRPYAVVVSFADITARKQTQDETLRKTEALAQCVLDSLSALIVVLDEKGNIKIVNEACRRHACEIGGLFEKLRVGENYFTACQTAIDSPTNELAAELQGIRAVISGARSSFSLEYPSHSADQQRWFCMNALPLAERQNWVVVIHENITERKRSEDALIESRELLSLIIRHSLIYMRIKEVTPNGSRVIQASDNYQEMLCLAGVDMRGKFMSELFTATFAAKIEADDRVIIASNAVVQLDEDLNGRNYTTIKCPIAQRGKKLIASYIIDITEIKRVEIALRESESALLHNNSLLRSIMESPMDIIIFALDTSYRYTMYAEAHKRAMKALWGTDIEMGMNILDAITISTDRETARKNFDRALRGEHFIEIEEYGDPTLHRPLYKDRYNPIFDDDGVVSGLTVFVNDITEQMALEKEIINISKREQRRIGEELHDSIGQQISAIELISESIQHDIPASLPELADRTEQMGRLLRESIHQIRMLAHDLTGFKIVAHGLPDALAELARNVSFSGQVRCRFDCPTPVSVHDPTAAEHLYRIAQESVHNAIKHAEASVVTIQLTQEEETRLRISDDGKGFSIDSIQMSTTGMGLQVMKHRANCVGAQLKVESNPGCGVTVTCVLPENPIGNSRLNRKQSTTVELDPRN